jgi:RNA polymerase sigma factor (sigma-70 family)
LAGNPTILVSYLKMSLASDKELTLLMGLALNGDKNAYERVLHESVGIIRAVARRNGAPPDRVDDVIQDVLITLHRSRRNFDPERSFLAWISAIAKRRTIDQFRRRKRQDARELHAPFAYENYSDAGSPDHTIEMRSEAHRLKGAIMRLPRRQRQAVWMLAIHELSLGDAANLTGLTKTALKVSLHRGLRALRASFSGTG